MPTPKFIGRPLFDIVRIAPVARAPRAVLMRVPGPGPETPATVFAVPQVPLSLGNTEQAIHRVNFGVVMFHFSDDEAQQCPIFPGH
jgi:hypothetical protein